MPRRVVGGLIQAAVPLTDPSTPIDKIRQAAIDVHLPLVEEAGRRGVQILGLQEVFNGPYFAEGLAEWDGQLVQLTWQSNIAFVYDLASFTPRGTLRYTGEGWGLTRDRDGFILSDGTEHLRFLDPKTFRETRRITVTDRGRPVRDLNELEYIRGEIYANVWHTDRIARISPQSGRVIGWIDLRGLLSSGYRLDAEAVLNGIAHDAGNNRLFVTGKLWPRLFEIEEVPQK